MIKEKKKFKKKPKFHHKNVDILKLFLTKQGKILSKRFTGLTVKQQKKLSKAVKRARILALLSFKSTNKS